jgi:hypothetical protein
MNIVELETIETEEGVAFSLTEAGRIAAKGPGAALDRALARILPFRSEVAALLRERQGFPDPGEAIVTREISPNVPALAVQAANYRTWFTARGVYYTPSDEELARMMAAVEEGDEILFDFAHSFSVRKPNGLIVAVNRKGQTVAPSSYSPALK